MTTKLIFIVVFTVIIHAVETSSYSIRLAGIRLKKIAVSLSVVGIVLLVARTSNLLQAFLLGGIVDQAKQDASINLEGTIRLILLAASIGTLLAIFLYPTLTKLFSYVIKNFETDGSFIRMMKTNNIQKLKYTKKYVRFPKLEMIHRMRIGGIPKRIMLINMFATAIYTAGVLSALYASFLNPAYATNASTASGLVNGFATILLTVLLDPRIALLTERALQKENGTETMGKMYGWLMISRFLGTLLTQVLFVPGANWILWIISITN
ncbi:lipid II flippase Amj family protein [Bacillus sp. 3103sda1]|uniref:lipid II flippase Amj family protein n=1 Tax=Bacillus sp. 3103sda1 TaxID=2953808 RepID=UPI00209E9788|nr:lipid II flippase Amj family protein [Bacillus sp. 3103sda1]MCP1123587.1 lipid II flippase Amj family protein [Bacillus sp. 3103sda1]